jgi:hypothetical protein
VDVPQLTPGPQTNLEAAFAPKGEPLPRDWPILTLDFPTFHDLLEVRKEGRPVLSPLPVASDAAIAKQAARMAGRGRIFLVTWGTASLDDLRRTPGPVANFMAALPPRFREVEFRTYPGLSFFGEAVHVLDGAPAQHSPNVSRDPKA